MAIDAAIYAGQEIIRVYDQDFTVEFKDDHSPLTEADKAAHAVIVASLESSGLPVFSEEGKSIPFEIRSNYEWYWLVDPLDGTKEFIKRNGEFTVNIALMRMNVPVVGVIAQPVTQKIWCGIPGVGFYCGSFSDGTSILNSKVSPQSGTDQIKRVLASRSHRSAETEQFISELKNQAKVEIISAGSALKFCLLAEGKADVYPRFAPTMEWDTAAGHAILMSVGKNIYTYPSNTVLTYNNKPNPVNDWFVAR